MSRIPIDTRLKAEALMYELHGWAGNNHASPQSDCMAEAAILISDLLKIANASSPKSSAAQSILQQAEAMIAERGKRRDAGQERSMQRIVKTFEALTDHKMTEVEGWLFMVVLKLCRERTGSDIDNWIDGAAYMGLAAEAVEKMKGNSPSA